MGAVHLQRDGAIARIEIADLERHNAMSVAMWEALHDAILTVDGDRSLRVCIVRGAGDRAFVSGANIGEFETARSSEEAVQRYNALVSRTQGAIAGCRVPVIAAISGYCFGGGLGIALSCDLRYANASARFRMPAGRLGLGYAYAGIKAFVQQLGPQGAAEAFFSARIYDAPSAQRLGIVAQVVDDVFAHCDALAQDIAANAPLTLQAGKRAMQAVLRGDADLAPVHEAVEACFRSQDYAEGRRAFAEKRPPRFEGR
jgi:enoyl-CoA hydratase/carnithine racemase